MVVCPPRHQLVVLLQQGPGHSLRVTQHLKQIPNVVTSHVHCRLYIVLAVEAQLGYLYGRGGGIKIEEWKLKISIYPVFTLLRNYVFATNSNYLIPISLKPDAVNFWYYKLKVFDLVDIGLHEKTQFLFILTILELWFSEPCNPWKLLNDLCYKIQKHIRWDVIMT